MYTDYGDYPHLKKLPTDLESALEKLDESKELNEAFGEKIINSYVKLKNNEINNFNNNETFSKEKPITDWEKLNTLDC
jgi:glutamine synthetase